jgi:hypothetical protein
MISNAVGLIAVAVTVILAIIGATWHLSTKIGDLRVQIAERSEKVDTMWTWFTGDVRRPQATSITQRAGQS